MRCSPSSTRPDGIPRKPRTGWRARSSSSAIASLMAAGVSPLPPVTGQDAELAGLQRILAGDQYMTVYKALKPEAYQAATLAIDLVNGRTPPGQVEMPVQGARIPSFLLKPVAVTRAQI